MISTKLKTLKTELIISVRGVSKLYDKQLEIYKDKYGDPEDTTVVEALEEIRKDLEEKNE